MIIKKHDLCQCSLSAGSWYLEANIAYCAEDPDSPSTHLKLYYTVNMATVIYQFQEKLKTEGITDLTLFNEQIPFDAREPDLIVEEDSYVLHDTSPAVNYKEVMEDFAMICYLSKPDLAMSMGEPSQDIYVCGQFVSGRITLDKKFPYDFIILKWDTIALSLIDLDLPMPTTLQIFNWQKSKIKRMFDSSNSYFRIVAHNPNTLKVRAITGAYNLHNEVLEDDTEEFQDAPQPDQPEQPTAVNQPTLEVVVTNQQHTMTFNGEQVHICEEVILSHPKVLKLLQSVKLKTMFIPLAPTTPTTSTPSSPSSSTPPLDDGITTVKYYIYIQTNLNTRTDATA